MGLKDFASGKGKRKKRQTFTSQKTATRYSERVTQSEANERYFNNNGNNNSNNDGGGPNTKVLVGILLLAFIVIIGGVGFFIYKDVSKEKKDPAIEQFENNVKASKKLNEDQLARVQSSQKLNSGTEKFSPGPKKVEKYAAMNKKQLQELDKVEQISIFVNGVIRDEYRVPATTLYGQSNIDKYKKEFEESLRKKTGQNMETTYADRFTGFSELKDFNVGLNQLDETLLYLNNFYINVAQDIDMEEKVIVKAETITIHSQNMFKNLKKSAEEFLTIKINSDSTDEQKKKANEFYNENFANALKTAEQTKRFTYTLGGFSLEDGLWVPNDMDKFAWDVYNLLFVQYTGDTAQYHKEDKNKE